MQQIVNVTIDESGRSIADSKSIGLQYETGVAQFVIAPDPSWVSDQYFYYLIVSPPEDSEKKQYAVPLVNQGGTFVFKISSGITWTVGNYKFAFIAMSKELTDGKVPSDGIVSISTAWSCKIEKSILDYVSLQKQPEDANFQLLYTDLMALSVEVRNQINYAQTQGDYAKKTADDILAAKEAGEFNGKDGIVGKDGISPTIETEQIDGGTRLTITDANGTNEVILKDGEDGLTPYIGNNGNWWIGDNDTGISPSGGGSGTGDMLKITYDKNNDGIVDNAEKVNGHTVETDVPPNAKFTDTLPELTPENTYTKLETDNKINEAVSGIKTTEKIVFLNNIQTTGWIEDTQTWEDGTVTTIFYKDVVMIKLNEDETEIQARMLETDIPHVIPLYTNIELVNRKIQEDWNKIDRAVSINNALRVYAKEIPTTEISIQVEVIR